ncbi:MAG: lactate/malate dehydrogenase family protein [Candidatus Merdousia sp.]|nr:lactate/malate dehydrogenase family protein [Candidatus Merdousia sp.]
MKVSIIGGGGRVGSCAAFALECMGLVSEIQIIDANAEAAEGEALDLLHGSAVLGGQRINTGCYKRAADSDMFIITAGLRRKPDESRLDLINRNVSLFRQILASIKEGGYKRDAFVFVVSNPVDILTYIAAQELDLPRERVIGLGTMLDTSRFRALIAKELKVPATQVNATVLGEHGDSMFPVWSAASIAGLPFKGFEGFDLNFQNRIFERTRQSGAEVIKRKGGAGYAVGASIAAVVRAILLDTREILPVSTVQTGAYGLRDVSISVPTVVGSAGALRHVELELWPKESQALLNSANSLKQTLAKV